MRLQSFTATAHVPATTKGYILSDNATASKAATPLPSLTKLLYDRQSAAFALSISTRAIDYLIAQKKLAFRRIGAKKLIPHGELVRFARGNYPSLKLSGATA